MYSMQCWTPSDHAATLNIIHAWFRKSLSTIQLIQAPISTAAVGLLPTLKIKYVFVYEIRHPRREHSHSKLRDVDETKFDGPLLSPSTEHAFLHKAGTIRSLKIEETKLQFNNTLPCAGTNTSTRVLRIPLRRRGMQHLI